MTEDWGFCERPGCEGHVPLSHKPRLCDAHTVATHRVTLEIEDGCVTLLRTECLVKAGGCHMGCPDIYCEWGHSRDGCDHCEESCGCDCATEGCASLLDGYWRIMGKIREPLDHECRCATFIEHQKAGACPHTFVDTGNCWLLPWVADGDGDWLYDDLPVMTVIRAGHEDEHPPEQWTLDYASIDGEHEAWWAPCDPIMSTLRRIS